jgi:hypothetical protein
MSVVYYLSYQTGSAWATNNAAPDVCRGTAAGSINVSLNYEVDFRVSNGWRPVGYCKRKSYKPRYGRNANASHSLVESYLRKSILAIICGHAQLFSFTSSWSYLPSDGPSYPIG